MRAPDIGVMVCHDCCCGMVRKHPGVDHEAQRAALLAVAGDDVPVRVVDCLGVCERSNVVLIRDLRRTRPGRDTWLGELIRPGQVDALVGWVESRCGPMPEMLEPNLFDHLRPSLDRRVGEVKPTRIVSLLPSTTEILFALGAGDQVVGVTFECDSPAQARERTVVSTSAMPEGLRPSEIDEFVSRAMAAGEDLYHLDADALGALDADLVVAQDLCAVCAVDVSVVDDALDFLGCSARVLTIDPHTLDQVLASIVEIGDHTGHESSARTQVAGLRARLDAVEDAVAGCPPPRVMVLEWTDPPFAPGHWIPEMVTRAGGLPVLGRAGEKSFRVGWDDVHAAEPDLVVCAPCGFALPESVALGREVLDRLPAVPVWAVDANASFARPGPRLVDGVETLARIFHPSAQGLVDLSSEVAAVRC